MRTLDKETSIARTLDKGTSIVRAFDRETSIIRSLVLCDKDIKGTSLIGRTLLYDKVDLSFMAMKSYKNTSIIKIRIPLL